MGKAPRSENGKWAPHYARGTLSTSASRKRAGIRAVHVLGRYVHVMAVLLYVDATARAAYMISCPDAPETSEVFAAAGQRLSGTITGTQLSSSFF